MALLGKSDLSAALARLGELALARADDREQLWQSLTPFLQPGRELKARYAFDDLWEETHGAT